MATFPIAHPLYGTLTDLRSAPFLTPARLADYSATTSFEDATELGICAQCFFQTSGTTSRAKSIPYSESDLERQADHEARAFARLGMTADDVVMTLAAPPPSISSFASVTGSQRLGARVVNSCYVDYDRAFRDGTASAVTTIFATPLVAREVAEDIVADHGSLAAALPAMRRVVLFGDLLPPHVAAGLQRLWGCDLRRLYGTVEADVVAVECPRMPGELHVMDDKLVLELIPLERIDHEPGPDDVLALRDCADGQRGEILISDLERDLMPIVRYRIGDVVEVHASPCACGASSPRVRMLGRATNLMSFSGRHVCEADLHDAIAACFGTGLRDWYAEVDDERGGATALRVFLDGHDPPADGRDRLMAELRARCRLDGVDLAGVDVGAGVNPTVSPIAGVDAKARRIVRVDG